DYMSAVERGDAKAQADFWTAEGTYSDETGRTVKARDALTSGSNQAPGAATRVKSASSKVRFVSADTAVEEGEFLSPPVNGSAAEKHRYSALWVRDGGHWKLDNVKELPIESSQNADDVACLNAFTGEWSGEVNKIAIRLSAKWDGNKKF